MGIEEKITVHFQVEGVKKLSAAIKQSSSALKNLSINQVRNNQAMQGFNTRINALNKQLEPLKKGLKESFQQMSRPAETAEQKVQGILNSQTSLNKQSKIMEKQLRQTGFERLAKKADSFGGALGVSQKNFKELNKRGIGFNTVGGRMGSKLRMMTAGLKGFRMEMLGVMFFGMAMQRFFTSLLRPATELTGLFELWGTTLQILFLPVALELLELLLPFFEYLMNLSDSTKLMIGKFVLFGLALGFVLFIVGTLALGIGSMILAFGGIFNIIDKLIPDIDVLGVNMSSFLEAGLSLSIVTGLVDILKKTFGGLLDKFFELDFVGEALDKLGIKVGENETAWGTFKTFVTGVIDKVKENLGFDTEFGLFDDLIKNAKDLANDFTEDFKKGLEEMGIMDFIDSIGDLTTALEDIVPSLKTIAGLITTIANAFTSTKELFAPNLLGRTLGIDTGNSGGGVLTGGPTLGSGGGSTIINNIFNGFTSDDLARALDDRDRDLVSSLNARGPGTDI